jgi:guanylate kinase
MKKNNPAGAKAATRKGALFILAAPSGAGKTSISRRLARGGDFALSVSHTTRAPRPGEADGRDYFFVSDSDFQAQARAGAFLESAEVHGHRYGTAAKWVEQRLAAGADVLLEIDWQGARQVRKNAPEAVSVFVLPPSPRALRARLIRRAQDSPRTIARRLAAAADEARHADEFDYVIINRNLDSAVADFRAVARAAALKSAANRAFLENWRAREGELAGGKRRPG